MCPANLELYIIYIYLLLTMPCHKGKISLDQLYPRNIEDTATTL